MDTLLVIPLIQCLQTLPAEVVSCILFGVCAISLLWLLRLFGIHGLYLYNIVGVVASNIQVLRGAQFGLSHEPVALGTVVFATTYLCSDLLTEHYGKEAAKTGIWLCFSAQVLMTVLMVMTIGYPPLSFTEFGSIEIKHMIAAEQAMAVLFTPSPRLLFASLVSFCVSQLFDILLFEGLRKLTCQKWLWLRTTVSTLGSAVVDTVLFSVLAWVVLSSQSMSWSVLFFTYILGTLVFRAIISILSVPIMYVSGRFKPIRS